MNVYRNTIRNSQKVDKQSRYLSMDEWRNNVVGVEYYSAIKRNKILIRATRWMSLENRLSEGSQTQKLTSSMIPLT